MAFYPSSDSVNGYSVILNGDLTITPANQGNYNEKLIVCTGASTITLGKDIMNNFKTQVRPSSSAGVTVVPVAGVLINGATDAFTQGAGNGALIEIVYGVHNNLTVATISGALNSQDVTNLKKYQRGVWTPIDQSGAGLIFVGAYGDYIRTGDLVAASFRVVVPANASAANNSIGGLPFPSAATRVTSGLAVSYASTGYAVTAALDPLMSKWSFATFSGSLIRNTDMAGATVQGVITYMTDAP